MSWFNKPQDLTAYDKPCCVPGGSRSEPSAEIEDVRAILRGIQAKIDHASPWKRIQLINQLMEGGQVPNLQPAEERGLSIEVVEPIETADGGVVHGEWITGNHSDPGRRLLFIHGGGFVGGSPQSHRSLTMALAERTNFSICSIQYRMFPRYRRKHGLADVRAAYDWVFDNGPDGSSPTENMVVCGDSAGANMSLALLQWARDAGRRSADACIAFAPVTDVGLHSPTCREKFENDIILGHFFERILQIPAVVRHPLVDMFHSGWPYSGRRADPQISPVYGDLSNLPPTLIQGSDSELLRGDSIRYTNKAREAGSDVVYQSWPGMVHVFQLFEPILPEADEALNRVCEFLSFQCEQQPHNTQFAAAVGT